jgi:hypothetical protein
MVLLHTPNPGFLFPVGVYLLRDLLPPLRHEGGASNDESRMALSRVQGFAVHDVGQHHDRLSESHFIPKDASPGRLGRGFALTHESDPKDLVVFERHFHASDPPVAIISSSDGTIASEISGSVFKILLVRFGDGAILFGHAGNEVFESPGFQGRWVVSRLIREVAILRGIVEDVVVPSRVQ